MYANNSKVYSRKISSGKDPNEVWGDYSIREYGYTTYSSEESPYSNYAIYAK